MADGSGLRLANNLDDLFLGEELPPLEWIPNPDRFYLFVIQVAVKTVTDGGIIIPGTMVADQEWNHGLGLVIKVGPAVYRGKRFEDMGLHPSEGPKPGDLVLFQARTPNRVRVSLPGGGSRLFLEIADDAILGRVQREHMHRIKFQVG
jgi:co-chaperonin GroES (HSP10)